jgi:drug/metabolite transporter (DMT)-like permease
MGEWLALAAALCFAIGNVTIVRGAQRGGHDNGAFLSLLMTALISAIGWQVNSLLNGSETITARGVLWLIAAGVFTGFFGRVFLYASIERLGAMRASAVKRLSPFIAVLLGVVVLGEQFAGGAIWGALLIVASFGVLLQAQWRAIPDSAASRLLSAGYVYGALSAAGYALGNLLRKAGMLDAPDPFFGAMVGTLVGAALFVGASVRSNAYRLAIRATFRRPNPWLYAAGAMGSFGQILNFAALRDSPMSTVALVLSMEVFFTIGLSLLFLAERLTLRVAVAAVLGVAGTVLLVGAPG